MRQFLVSVGAFATLVRCHAAEVRGELPRGTRVVCRTPRGLEIGQLRAEVAPDVEFEGEILRAMTVEDELLADRLEKHRAKAVDACQQRLHQAGSEATLIDIDPLFDGRTLLFFFLGTVDEEVQQITNELTETYAQQVGSKHFAKLLAEGCGPGCGTEAKAGGGCSGGCAVCVVAAACRGGN